MATGRNQTRRTAIVMSRLPRLIDPRAAWVRGLRACLRRVLQQRRVLLIAPGIAGADFVRRGAEVLGIELEVLSEVRSDANATPSQLLGESSELDSRVAQQAEELLVLGIRSQGTWHRLLRERLLGSQGDVTLIELDELQPAAIRQELVDLGADVWRPDPTWQLPFDATTDEIHANDHRRIGELSSDSTVRYTLQPLPSSAEWSFLTHTTRACPGPWPGQSAEDYLDRILQSRGDACHSALATLLRIVRQRRLLGSSRTIRGGHAMVSLTEVPLSELPALRCYRTHRMHWDFEPYGVCIRRSALVDAGARPVIYGTEQTWEQLPPEDRPWFQLHESTGGSSAIEADVVLRTVDWSREREWRFRGDLDLWKWDPRDILIFVPTFEDARAIIPHSAWPVTLWPADISPKKRVTAVNKGQKNEES